MSVLEQLRRHSPSDDEESADLAQIVRFVCDHEQPFDRRLSHGHLTGSALVVAHDGAGVLLLHHQKLQRWLQPGGHAEAGENAGEEVALREAREETGLLDLALHGAAPRPLDVDVHDIPARPGEPAHQHLDLRYLVVARRDAPLQPGEGESVRIRWFGWDELAGLDLDSGLRRAFAKARRYFP
jgi:8-oxo-dGTP pyrophosphatase MutT (NUDIX family)